MPERRPQVLLMSFGVLNYDSCGMHLTQKAPQGNAGYTEARDTAAVYCICWHLHVVFSRPWDMAERCGALVQQAAPCPSVTAYPCNPRPSYPCVSLQDMVERCNALLQQGNAVRQQAAELELGRNSAASAMAGLQDDLSRARGEACVLPHVCRGGLGLGECVVATVGLRSMPDRAAVRRIRKCAA